MAKTKTPQEILWEACRSGEDSEVTELLDQGGDVNGRSDYGGARKQTPLHGAAESSSSELLRLLVKRGADVHAVDGEGRTALWPALSGRFPGPDLNDFVEILGQFETLVELGADPRRTDGSRQTLLHHAASIDVGEDDEPAEEAVTSGRLPGFSARTPDEALAWQVGRLVGLGLSVDAQDENQYTPLHQAISSNNSRMARHLLARGAKVDARAAGGHTPLHLASLQETAAVLLDGGADPNAVDDEGATPLHARVGYHLEAAKLLVARGARLDVQNQEGKTPFDLIEDGDEDWEELLRHSGKISPHGALRALDAQIEADPENVALYKQRGDARFKLGEMEDAASDYRRCTQLDPSSFAASFNLGQALAQNGDFAEALPAFDRAVALDPQSGAARLSRAVSRSEMRDHAGALADAEEVARGPVNDEQRAAAAELVNSLRAKIQLAGMSPIAVTEAWYGVKLPDEYRQFLEQRTWERFPRHRPGRLPSYGKTPQVRFIYGRSVYGIEGGEGRFDPEDAETLAKTFQLASDVGVEHRVGDYLKQEVFSGLEFDNYEEGYLDKLVPFALLGDGDESQALAIDVGRGATCPVLMYEHETGEFEPVSNSIAEFLNALKPLGDDDDDDGDDEDEDEDDEDGEDDEGEDEDDDD